MKIEIADVQIIRKAMNWNPVAHGFNPVDREDFEDNVEITNYKRDNWANGDLYIRVENGQLLGFVTLDKCYFMSPKVGN